MYVPSAVIVSREVKGRKRENYSFSCTIERIQKNLLLNCQINCASSVFYNSYKCRLLYV